MDRRTADSRSAGAAQRSLRTPTLSSAGRLARGRARRSMNARAVGSVDWNEVERRLVDDLAASVCSRRTPRSRHREAPERRGQHCRDHGVLRMVASTQRSRSSHTDGRTGFRCAHAISRRTSSRSTRAASAIAATNRSRRGSRSRSRRRRSPRRRAWRRRLRTRAVPRAPRWSCSTSRARVQLRCGRPDVARVVDRRSRRPRRPCRTGEDEAEHTNSPKSARPTTGRCRSTRGHPRAYRGTAARLVKAAPGGGSTSAGGRSPRLGKAPVLVLREHAARRRRRRTARVLRA